MYSHVITLKQMFAAFFPKFKANVIRDDNAWQIVDRTHMFWANDALNLKRSGDYVGACKLYFDHIPRCGAITIGWAEGIFKTLASAGDIADALEFGLEWYNNYADQSQIKSDNLVMHLINILGLVQNNPIIASKMSFPEYLKSISGNPNYSIDMKQTDLYTNEWLRTMRTDA